MREMIESMRQTCQLNISPGLPGVHQENVSSHKSDLSATKLLLQKQRSIIILPTSRMEISDEVAQL